MMNIVLHDNEKKQILSGLRKTIVSPGDEKYVIVTTIRREKLKDLKAKPMARIKYGV